jgi:hypothetical protein
LICLLIPTFQSDLLEKKMVHQRSSKSKAKKAERLSNHVIKMTNFTRSEKRAVRTIEGSKGKVLEVACGKNKKMVAFRVQDVSGIPVTEEKAKELVFHIADVVEHVKESRIVGPPPVAEEAKVPVGDRFGACDVDRVLAAPRNGTSAYFRDGSVEALAEMDPFGKDGELVVGMDQLGI